MENTANKVKLGIFVLTGTILLIVCLYIIGTKQNIFNKTISIFVKFSNVNGLISGNNIRFAGIAIGTVKNVMITNDTTVVVEMIIREDAIHYVRKGSTAEIGSDGLMGNKLINISTSESNSAFVQEGDTIQTKQAIATDDMMRTLSTTNQNVLEITTDLKKITRKIHDSTPVWDLLSDTTSADNIRKILTNIEKASSQASRLTTEADILLTEIRKGEGMAATIISDQEAAKNLELTVANLKAATDTAKLALHHMHEFMEDLNLTPGPLGVLARDTAMAGDMKSVFANLNTSTVLLNENLTALRRNFLFKKYFRKKAKEEKINPVKN